MDKNGETRLICLQCSKKRSFKSQDTLERHINNFHKSTEQTKSHPVKSDLVKFLPFYCSTSQDLKENLISVPPFNNYLSKIKSFQKGGSSQLLFLSLNIGAYTTVKMQHILEILGMRNVDILLLSETHIDESTPASALKNAYYHPPLRRDRNKHGGGLLVFVRKEYKLTELERRLDFETICFKITIKDQNYNFIASYKPPKDDNSSFLEHLDSQLCNIDPCEPIFIAGDLNMNLLNEDGDELKEFLCNN
jgi:hypothetical protein